MKESTTSILYPFVGCEGSQPLLESHGSNCLKLYIRLFSCDKNVTTIGEDAFSDYTNFTQLISYATTPPTCGTQALDDINKWNYTLMIPKGTFSVYQAADQWKEFFFIEDIPAAINGVVVDGDDADKNAPVYNLQGMKMQNADNLPKGIYIKGGKKFVIK